MHWIFYLLLIAGAFISWILVVLTWPGLWLMTAAAAAYALVTRERFIGWHTLLALLVLTLTADLFELLAGRMAARRSRAGDMSAIGGAVGGLAGGIAFSFVPIPIIAPILGLCLGCFAGSVVTEVLSGRGPAHSLNVGAHAVGGKLVGFISKLFIGGAMILVILWMGWP